MWRHSLLKPHDKVQESYAPGFYNAEGATLIGEFILKGMESRLGSIHLFYGSHLKGIRAR